MQRTSRLKTVRTLLKRKHTRIKKDRILFTSFNGHYSDSPKYICEKIHQLAPKKELVWLVKKEYLQDLPSFVKGVDIDSPEAENYRGSAAVIVDNVYGEKETYQYGKGKKARASFRLFSFLKKKKKQRVFTTWHGTPLKRMARHQHGSTIVDFSCPNTTMLLGNTYTLDIMRDLTFGKMPMRLVGSPRNDILFTKGEGLKEKLGLPADKQVLLFAPTFRTDDSEGMQKNIRRSGLNQLEEMDFLALFSALKARFGGEWTLVCRFHYHVEALVDFDKLSEKYGDRIINGNRFDDMAEYLACADVLLTDASSSMYDFSLTGKPCFLFFPDLEYYKGVERGFYTPIEELPFPVAETFTALTEVIQAFDEEAYARGVERMLAEYGYVNNERSALQAAEYILSEVNE